MRALIVLGGDAPDRLLLLSCAGYADLKIAADRGLEACRSFRRFGCFCGFRNFRAEFEPEFTAVGGSQHKLLIYTSHDFSQHGVVTAHQSGTGIFVIFFQKTFKVKTFRLHIRHNHRAVIFGLGNYARMVMA